MTLQIIVAPLSNDPLRDWPLENFRRVAELCLDGLDCVLEFVGTRPQRLAVAHAIRSLPSDRCRNRCGQMPWQETVAMVAQADCVLANNSGLAHVAAELGVPAVSVFCGSHSPLEWMALGSGVTVLIRKTACAPCTIARIEDCPYDRRCFTDIAPQTVFEAVQAKSLAHQAARQQPDAGDPSPPLNVLPETQSRAPTRWLRRLPALRRKLWG